MIQVINVNQMIKVILMGKVIYVVTNWKHVGGGSLRLTMKCSSFLKRCDSLMKWRLTLLESLEL